jgi:hypothetical protein
MSVVATTVVENNEGDPDMDVLSPIITRDATRIAGLALALVIGGAGAASVPAALAQSDGEPVQSCALVAPGAEAEPWVRTELFFGMAKPDGTAVSEAEWGTFLDTEITPRFPEGLTVLSGAGQWQEEDGDIVEEGSKIVVLLYPREAVAESNAEIEQIRAAYEERFHQESVLRADDDRPVCASF